MSNRTKFILLFITLTLFSITMISASALTDYEITLNKTYGGELDEIGAQAIKSMAREHLILTSV